MMSDANATTSLMFTLPFDREVWIARAREAALAYRNRGIPEMQRTELPAPRRSAQLRAVN